MAAGEESHVHVMCLGPGGADEPSVRAVCQLRNGRLLVAAEDRSLSVWSTRADEEGTMAVKLLAGVELADLAAAPRSAAALPGGVGCVIGDQAGGLTLLLEDGELGPKVVGRVADAHSAAVISVSTVAGQRGHLIVSGGWDGRAMEWTLDEAGPSLERVGPVADLDAECDGPCTVAALGPDLVITGHAGVRQPDGRVTDASTCVWKRAAAAGADAAAAAGSDAAAAPAAGWARASSVHDHAGPVRGVASIGAASFVTCGNDGMVVAYRLDRAGVARESARAQLPSACKPGAKTLPVSMASSPTVGMLCIGTSDGGLVWFRVGKPTGTIGDRWAATDALLEGLLQEPEAAAPWLQRVHYERMPGPVWACQVLECGMVMGAAGSPLQAGRAAAFLAVELAGTEAELARYKAAVQSWISTPAAAILASAAAPADVAGGGAGGGAVQKYVAMPSGERVPVASGGLEGVQGQIDGEHSYFELGGQVNICRWDQATGLWQPSGLIDDAFVVTDRGAALGTRTEEATDAPAGAAWDVEEVVKFGTRDLALRFRWNEHPEDVAARFVRQHRLAGDEHRRSTLQYVLAKRHEAGYFDDNPPRITKGNAAGLSPQFPASEAAAGAAAGAGGQVTAPPSRHFPVKKDDLTQEVKVRATWGKALEKKNGDVPEAQRWTAAELGRAKAVCERLLETGRYHTWSGKAKQEENAAFVAPLVQAVQRWPAAHTGPVLDVLTVFCHACPSGLAPAMRGLAESVIDNLSVRPAAGSIAAAGFGSQFLCAALGSPELAQVIVGQLERLSGAVGELLDSLRVKPLTGPLAKQARHLSSLGRMLQLVALAVAARREVKAEGAVLLGSALLAMVEEVDEVAPVDAWAELVLAAVRALGTLATAANGEVRQQLREDGGVAEALVEACHLEGQAAEAAADLVKFLER